MYFSSSVRTPWATKPRWLISASAGRGGSSRSSARCSGRPARSGASGTLHRLEHGGRHVDALHLARDARARAAVAGELHDQRDVDELVEQAPAVEPEPVVLELLAVVGQEHDERVVVEAQRLELAHEAAELAVAEGYVPVVLRDHALAVERLLVVGARVARGVRLRRVRLEHAVEGRGRRVGHVRVHGVDVQEAGHAAPRAQERERLVHHDVRADELAARVVVAVEAGEEVEAAIEGGLRAVDHRVRDRGARGEARARRAAARASPAADRAGRAAAPRGAGRAGAT